MFGLQAFREALREDKRVWPLLVMVCCTMFGSGLVVPVLSLYAVSFGVSATLVGMLVTIFGIGRIVMNFPSGWLSQRVGRRPLLVAGPAILAIGAIGAAMTTDFNWLVFWRFVQGLGSGMYQTVSLAALADISSPKTRGRLVGVYHAAIQFGASFGPLIGGTVASAYGLAAPFWVLLAISLITCVLALATFRDIDVRAPHSMSGALGAARRGLLSVPFLAISMISCVVFFMRTACMFQLLPLIGSETFGLGVAAIGVAITIISFAMFIVLPSSGVIIDKFGSRAGVIISMLGMIAGVALVLIHAHPIFFWLSMLVYGLAAGLSSTATGTYTIEVLPRHKYGEGMGLQRTISDFGYIMGPVFAGLAADLSGYGQAGGVIATLALASLATIAFVIASGGSRPVRPAP